MPSLLKARILDNELIYLGEAFLYPTFLYITYHRNIIHTWVLKGRMKGKISFLMLINSGTPAKEENLFIVLLPKLCADFIFAFAHKQQKLLLLCFSPILSTVISSSSFLSKSVLYAKNMVFRVPTALEKLLRKRTVLSSQQGLNSVQK